MITKKNTPKPAVIAPCRVWSLLSDSCSSWQAPRRQNRLSSARANVRSRLTLSAALRLWLRCSNRSRTWGTIRIPSGLGLTGPETGSGAVRFAGSRKRIPSRRVPPELGGRIWSAYDKIARRELFYRTTVIKPGRYNQRGGWPVATWNYTGRSTPTCLPGPENRGPGLQRHDDGSAAVVLSHIDHFFRDKISLEVTLRPGRAFLETTIRLRNRNLAPAATCSGPTRA